MVFLRSIITAAEWLAAHSTSFTSWAQSSSYIGFYNPPYIILHIVRPSQVVSESTQQQQDIMWWSATRDTQEKKKKEQHNFPPREGGR